MAPDATQVVVGKPKASGGALVAPPGTAGPTDATSALNAGFDVVGYVSSDGLVLSIDASTSDIIAWGGDKVRTVQTEHGVTLALTMIETNETTQAVFWGADNVVATPANGTHGNLLAITVTADELPRGKWDFEIKDGDRIGRVYAPDAQVTERGEVNFVDEDAISYPVTLTCYPDGTGVKLYIWWDDRKLAA